LNDIISEANYAGNTAFVAPELVIGTLRKGVAMFRSLRGPFTRAAFMMFLVAEVHPFSDGNGRIASVMMNAVYREEARLIMPPTRES
jgi:Fic family protein